MKVMGATNVAQWLAWTIHYMIISLLTALILSLVFSSNWMAGLSFDFTWNLEDFDGNQTAYDDKKATITPVLAYSDFNLIFVTFFINLMQYVWFSFFCSTFFNKSSDAAGVVGMFTFIGFVCW